MRSLPAGRRRPGQHARRPADRVRQPRGRRAVRRRAVLPGRARGRARVSSRDRDLRAGHCAETERGRRARRARPGPPRSRSTPASSSRVEQEVMAAWIADRRKTVSAVVMDPYTGEVYAEATYPSYDANDYRAIAATDAGALHRPDRRRGLRAGLGVQDDDRRGRAGARGRSRSTTKIKDVGDAAARRRPDQDRRRRPPGRWAG